jgi:hypothetical protein
MLADSDRLNDLSGRVIALTALNALGAAFPEKVYENALAHEQAAAGLSVVRQRGASRLWIRRVPMACEPRRNICVFRVHRRLHLRISLSCPRAPQALRPEARSTGQNLRAAVLGGLAALLLSAPVHAADLPQPWVELAADGGLDVRAISAPGMPCPSVAVDGATVTTTSRGTPDAAYPVQVCVAHTAAAARTIAVGGLPVPALPPDIKRIVVIGDTGCRLKGDVVQDCNDPVQWPFAQVARLAAARHPDLVIHVGDYHYRETPCPQSRPGCAGSPYGDNWAVWQKDFFDPAAPLLAAAPWVLVRGNHELCSRGGHGWFRLLDPHAEPGPCADSTPAYALNLRPLNLLILDSADAADANANAAKVAGYHEQLQTLLADAPPHAWLLTHRPVWALVQGPDAKPGDILNATEQAAIRGLVPANLDMVLSGHMHDFTSYEFGPARPAQLVVGEGGDANDAISQPVTPGIAIDGLGIRRALAIADYGYVFLHRTTLGWAGTVHAIDDRVLAHCRLHGRSVSCHPAGH